MNLEQQIINQVPWVRIDGQSVIANASQNSLELLNQVATKIWHSLRSGQRQPEIIRQLEIDYQIDLDQAKSDVELILNLWCKAGLFSETNFENRCKRWHIEEGLHSTSFSDNHPLHQFVYQLSTHQFVIDYYQNEVFDAVHNVLEHLKVDIKDDIERTKILYRYRLNYNGKYQISDSNKKSHRFNTLDELVEFIQWTLIEKAYKNNDWLTILHSAALGDEHGQAIVFTAQRGSGKSTLTRLLQNHGLIYLADDVVPITYSGALQPIPTCQRFKKGSWKIVEIEDDSLHKIYSRHEGHFVKYAPPLTGRIQDWIKSWPVKAIVYPRYIANTECFKITKLNKIESLKMLCRSGTVFGGAIDQAQLESIINWINLTPSYSLTYSDLNAELVEEVRDLSE